MFSNRLIGQTAEKLAEKYLVDNGYFLVAKNYQTRHGEIDLICEKNRILVFVEVKMRSNLSAGLPEEAITKSKKEKLILAAEQFINDCPGDFIGFQFDAIALSLYKGNLEINHFENIF
ncbi:MAG: YraN family protein [Candidatus Buchananbacteria bacterium]|nr:YraN family protein [Candidatus Buchananbacteria bacterium]